MDWMPFYLTVSSGAFLVPLLLSYQKQMGELDKRNRTCVSQIEQVKANLSQIAEEEGRMRSEIEAAKARLEELAVERADLERKFQEVKRQYVSDGEDDGDQAGGGEGQKQQKS